MPNVPAFIGYRATGKTTVAKLLAERLGFECIDTDAEVVQRAGCSITEIFASRGESGFRDLECQVVDDVTQRDHVVLSFGGGAVLRPENRQVISGRCQPVVWLKASVETIFARMNQDALSQSQRPHLTSQGGMEEIRSVLAQRLAWYEQCATLALDTEHQTPDQLANAICDAIAAG